MQPGNKKEISCKAIFQLLNTVKKKNIDIDKILEGVPYDLSYLLNRQERIEWWAVCKIISNSRQYFSRSEFEQMGREFVADEFYMEGILFSIMLTSSNMLSDALKNQILKGVSSIVKPIFSIIDQQSEFIGKNKLRIHFSIQPGYGHCPELFYMSIGVLEGLGRKATKKGFKVDFTLTSNGGIYDVSWKEGGFLFNLKKWVRWLFNIRKAFLDLTESHNELVNQYNKLEESKRLLEKQTTQLTITHEITKSIRQSFDINETLKAITDTLVKESNFASARIKLFKDAEGKELDIECTSGADILNIEPIIKPIITDQNEIGELTIYPKFETEISEYEELLNYLLPIINISIHDSLILRTVTDYKNNLENKVEIRTAELKIARDELSKTVDLLQAEQQVQNRFFTNISHEFRTPLTLILGPVKQIAERLKDEKLKDQLGVVYKNANRLLGLVNQLLDISKLKSHKMNLQTMPQDIIAFLRDIVLSFSSYAERKRITLKLNSTVDELIVYLDKDKMEKIITNVLSNAFKFTPEDGKVEVIVKYKSSSSFSLMSDELKKDFVEILIRDTGIGITEDKMPNIFDRFYQVDSSHTRDQEGTGIGLSLTKELVELHKGTIKVESTEGKGTTVTIKIPLGKEHLKPEEICEMNPEKEYEEETIINLVEEFDKGKEGNKIVNDLTEKSGLPFLLIVEDNADVRNYITNNLNTLYKILEAMDGEDGWNKSVEQIPDLIISDIMMPKMDGFKLCAKLKTDERTSHIPVILLTAKASSADKIEGFEIGADDYIMKPFESEELKARIKNLIEQRKRIHEHFRKNGIIEFEQSNITSIDKRFLKKTFEIINKNMSDSAFGLESFAELLGVSRSVLHRKITSLTGESPGELIRRIRLKRASQLIEQNFGNISEISLEVGFSNPSQFARSFLKQFGVPPSIYQQKCKNNLL